MMKKTLFALAAFVAFSAPAHAQKAAVTSVFATAGSSYTVAGVSISSAPALSIVVDTNQVYKQVCVQNVDTSSALYCGETIDVSSITTNAKLGVIVAPAASATSPSSPTCFAIVAGMDFFCRTGSTSGTTRAVVIRAR